FRAAVNALSEAYSKGMYGANLLLPPASTPLSSTTRPSESRSVVPLVVRRQSVWVGAARVHVLEPGELELLHADIPTTTAAASTQIRTLASISPSRYVARMASEALLTAVKAIVANSRANKHVEAYAGYKALFSSPEFRTYPAPDQRQALKLMIHAKGMPQIPAPHVVEGQRACIEPLTELVSVHNDP